MKKANKNVKKQEKKNISLFSTDNEMVKLIFLILIVAVVFVVFYVITVFVTKENKTDNDNLEQSYEATIQYDKILAGNILNQKDNEYYVLVYFPEDQYVDLYMSYLSYYEMTVEGAVPYYTVDISDVFNNQFISDESNLNVSDPKELKFSDTTLLRIKDGKIISTYETKDNITAKFGRMTK